MVEESVPCPKVSPLGKDEQKRCVNIDWLEVYCMESVSNFPCNAEYYRLHGYQVRERSYGTRQYREMFTLLDRHDQPFIEIRRNPVSSDVENANNGIFSEYSTHIKLVNCYCYLDNAVDVFSQFLHQHDYEIVRLYRLDLCMDFEYFDKGDDPQKFLARYMAGRYAKINQCNLSGHASDGWDGRQWNSVSWGSPKSMVSTKLYNKTKELKEAKDKPYIRIAWFSAGLVDDWNKLTKNKPDGTVYEPTIWRVEFSIRSSARGWYVKEDNNGEKLVTEKHEHTLGTYATKLQQVHAFAYLAHHYFHFKKVRSEKRKQWLKEHPKQKLTALGMHFVYDDFSPLESVSVRKDRCEDKILFDFRFSHEPYKLLAQGTQEPRPASYDLLRRKLTIYRMMHTQPEQIKACDTILRQLEIEEQRSALPWECRNDVAKLTQLLISRRIKQSPKEPMSTSIKECEALLEIEKSLF